MESIKYSTENIKEYFSTNRIRWDQFYESERKVIDKIWSSSDPAVLDVGCGCGGLGAALREHFGARNYTGIEINDQAAQYAAILNPNAKVYHADFLTMDASDVPAESFDLVFSLGCIDWQLNFDLLFAKAWSMTRPGGYFVASFRLTTQPGVNDLEQSFQFINYEGEKKGEVAPYVVLNAADLATTIRRLQASYIYAYGYYGPPGPTAVTPFEKLCFCVFAIQKPVDGVRPAAPRGEMDLPSDIRDPMVALLE